MESVGITKTTKAKTVKSAATKKATKATKKPLAPAATNYESDEDVMDMDEVPVAQEKSRSIEQIYQKKTQLEHILLRPDTYIGSIESVRQSMWVIDPVTMQLVFKEVTFVPGLYKIFDEIVVNAADNKQRDSKMNLLKVDINVEEGSISVWNNGRGIPVVIHQEHNVHVPELIFGHLLTGSNFNDNEKKTTGGRNGYGAKLANIFSTEFVVETHDSSVNKRYIQKFNNNMSVKGKPTITTQKGSDFTCITFKPDFARFKMNGLNQDILSLMYKRIYDMAGTSDKSLKVVLNGEPVSIPNFSEYVDMYLAAAETPSREKVYEKVNDRWEVAIGISDGTPQQVSYVNSICTTKGGQHVQHIVDQVASKLMASLKKKSKGLEVKPFQIKNHLFVFVNALIENPAFDSQTKETLTTRSSAFGSTCVVSEKFLKQVEKCGVVEQITSWAKFKQTAELKRKSGTKKSKLVGIGKLDDANHAGTAKGKDCTLILTEGDSAKALAVSGLGVVGRDYFGVFPLKGKLLNVREANHAQILKNEEIQNLVKILGLKFGTTYTDTSSLRYGHLLIMTDQDHDGSHIKGLVINFIHHFWPSLLRLPGFLQEFITPIIKATKGKKQIPFYTIPEYEDWKESNEGGKGWSIKYYKGLGTSTGEEAKEYFTDLATHRIPFEYVNDEDDNAIELAFSKKRVDDRKQWLKQYEQGTRVDYNVENMVYSEFINKELILFSMADNIRSIPSVVDGLKPSQRKVLFGCFKRKLYKNEIKVSQLGGFVSEHSAYHHGEASLFSTIVNMAQNYVGSNNINLLAPNGQFGTRLLGGKDAASPRYIFTKLEEITRLIFHNDDDAVLTYLDEDGQQIEPIWYVPVIPMVLVNGSDGIGTGWSSTVPNYNPRDVIANIRRKISGDFLEDMQPWYRGFTGVIDPKMGVKERGTFTAHGTCEKINETTIQISELPLKTWTTNYKQFLETLITGNGEKEAKPLIKDFKENHTDTTVSFTITFLPEALEVLENAPGGLMKALKLEGSISTSNMHMFDQFGQIKRYESPLQVLDEFFGLRMEYYGKRKQKLVEKLTHEWKRLTNRMRFIMAVISGELVVSNRKKTAILQDLQRQGYDLLLPTKEPGEEENESEDAIDRNESDLAKGYDYLLSMKLWNLTTEKVEQLRKELQEKEAELQKLKSTSLEQMYLIDLDALEAGLDVFEEELEQKNSKAIKKSSKGAVASSRAKKPSASQKKVSVAASSSVTTSRETVSVTSAKPAATKARAAPPKPKPAPKPVTSDDEEILSLSERMALRMAVSPIVKRSTATLKTSKVLEEVQDSEEEKEDDVFDEVEEEKPVKAAAKTTSKSTKAPAAKAKRTRSPKKVTAKATTMEVEDTFTFVSPEKKKTKTVVRKKAVTTVPAAQKKTVKAKAPSKPAKVVEEEEEEEEEVIAAAPAPARRAARARQPVKYVASEEEEEEDDVFDEEDEEESDDYADGSDDSDFEE